MTDRASTFWSLSCAALLDKLQTSVQALTSSEAQERIRRYGPNRIKAARRTDSLALLLAQFKSPTVLILLFAAALSLSLSDPADRSIIIVIVFVSGSLGFYQERGGSDAAEKLLAIVQVKTAVLRDGKEQEIPVERS